MKMDKTEISQMLSRTIDEESISSYVLVETREKESRVANAVVLFLLLSRFNE